MTLSPFFDTIECSDLKMEGTIGFVSKFYPNPVILVQKKKSIFFFDSKVAYRLVLSQQRQHCWSVFDIVIIPQQSVDSDR